MAESRDIESYWHDKPLGLTLYFGSPNGNFLLRMYEKAKERAKKENRELEDILLDYGVVNRYEMQIREEYAEAAFNELAKGNSLDQFAINLLLSKIAVYETVSTDSGKIAYQFHPPFYEVFGNYQTVKINGKKNETDVEKSMKWIVSQVSRTLALLQEVYGKQWLFDWLEHLISEVEFTEKQEKIILFEKARVQNQENGMYLWYRKKMLEQKYSPENVYVKIEKPDDKLWSVRLKDIPTKFLIYVDSEGNYSIGQPKGMTLEQINDLGEKKGIDFINSPLFVVFEVDK